MSNPSINLARTSFTRNFLPISTINYDKSLVSCCGHALKYFCVPNFQANGKFLLEREQENEWEIRKRFTRRVISRGIKCSKFPQILELPTGMCTDIKVKTELLAVSVVNAYDNG